GTANMIRSAPCTASARSSVTRSTTPSGTAWRSVAGSRSQPTTSRQSPDWRRPLAKEPPIRPRPTTARRLISGPAEVVVTTLSFTLQNPGQRLEETFVFLGQADGYAQMVRHAVTCDRADNHALAQQPLIHRRCLPAEIDGNEIAARRDPGQAQLTEALLQLRHTFAVGAAAFSQIGSVFQAGNGGGQRQAVNVERLTYAVQHIGDLRVADCIAHPQGGQAVGLGEGSTDNQVGVPPDEVETVEGVGDVDIFGVGLIQHYQHAL